MRSPQMGLQIRFDHPARGRPQEARTTTGPGGSHRSPLGTPRGRLRSDEEGAVRRDRGTRRLWVVHRALGTVKVHPDASLSHKGGR